MRPHHTRDVLLTAEQIEKRVDAMVVDMADQCRTDDLVMIGILRGSFMFLADLVRALYHHGIHPRIDFMTLESYGAGTESSGRVKISKDINVDVAGSDVVIIDDILDTGRTLSFARKHLMEKGVKSVRTCTLLDKPSRRAVPFEADFKGFVIEDHFVVGYGLDFDSRYRELPYIAKVSFTD
ncbi:MAG TPA: hypoxanthine phosphoribosyltransferase [Kiritimatiellia bacterium]